MMNNMLNMLAQLKSNPMKMLSPRFNVPSNINSPQDIVQYLLNTGQISQNQLNNVMNDPRVRNYFK